MKAEDIVGILLEEPEEFDARDYFLTQKHDVWYVHPNQIRQMLREPDPDTQDVYKVVSWYRRKRGALTFHVRGTREQNYSSDPDRLKHRLSVYLDRLHLVGGKGSPFHINVWRSEPATDLDIEIIKSEPEDPKFGYGPHPYA